MSGKPGPIVITLKKRLGPAKRDEPDEEDDEPAGSTRAGGGLGARSRSRSPLRDGSEKRSLSPPRGGVPTVAPSSVLNVSALEDIFARFHGQLDTWLQGESGKLERAEVRGNQCREQLQRCADRVCGFLRDHAPGADLGPDPNGEGFTTRALPQFLDLIEEDRRALQEASSVLAAFADRRFPKNEELTGLKAEASPMPLLRAILRLLAAAPGAKARAGGRQKRARASGRTGGGAPPAPAEHAAGEGAGEKPPNRPRGGARHPSLSPSVSSGSDEPPGAR